MPRSLRIATWNLERPSLKSWRKLPAQLEQIAKVDADVWVLTESRAGLPLVGSHPYVVHAPPHPRRPDTDERWVSIWSRYPLGDAGIAASPRGTVAAVVQSPLGPIAVYGTVVPWSHEPSPDGVVRAWTVHEDELERQAAEWGRVARRFDAVCVAGDFNQAWQRGGYGSARLRSMHQDAARSAGMRCLTGEIVEDGMPVIDHVLVSDPWGSTVGARMALSWPRRNTDNVRMSDHSGVAIDLGD